MMLSDVAFVTVNQRQKMSCDCNVGFTTKYRLDLNVYSADV